MVSGFLFVFLFFCLFSLETKRVYDHSIECIFEKELSQFNEKKEEEKKRYILIIRARLLGLELLFEIRILASDYTCVRIVQGTRWALSPRIKL